LLTASSQFDGYEIQWADLADEAYPFVSYLTVSACN